MKIKSGFMLREIAGTWVVVPIGQRVVEFNGLMTLSETGAVLWKRLEVGATVDELAATILEEYDVDEQTARVDVEEFVTAVSGSGLFEE